MSIPNRLKMEVFSQGTDDSKNLRCETLYIGNDECVKICSFAVLGIKLLLEENDDLNRSDHSNSFSRKLNIDTNFIIF